MKIIKYIEQIAHSRLKETNLSITIGVFDGLHIGHKRLIESTINCARINNTKSAMLTFTNHPLQILAPAYSPPPLLNDNEKIDLLRDFGLDFLIMIPFNKQLSNQTPEKFINNFLLKQMNIKCVIAGYDFRFGKDAKGDLFLLRKLASHYGFQVKVVDPVSLYGRIVSSTEIRELLLDGKIPLANQMLAREYSITGIVEKGCGRGKSLGFPTANLRMRDNKLLPKCGVYLARVNMNDKEMFGMLNIGKKPTFNSQSLTIEIHIFNFNNFIYGQSLKISFICRLRSEKKFKSPEELKSQLIKDKEKSLSIINRYNFSGK